MDSIDDEDGDRQLERAVDNHFGASSARSSHPGCLDDYLGKFQRLKRSPNCLIAIYIVTFVDSLAYYAFSYALIMHLGMEVGLPDSLSGIFYGIFGICISISSLVLGFLADYMGIRNSICISSAIGFLARLSMAYAVLGRATWLSALLLFGLVAPSIALIGPPIPTAIKRYTSDDTRALAFTIYYGVMNIAAFVATPIVDMMRLQTTDEILLLPPYALLIAMTGVLQIPVFFVSLFWIRDVTLNPDGHIVPIVVESYKTRSLMQRIREVARQKDFWRALTIVTCLIGVKSSFRYFDALYLPYVTRAYQDAATFPYLTLLALNPIIVIVATITGAITILTDRMRPLTSMLVGSFIGGLAPYWMAAGPYLWNIMAYIIFTSLGEIIWSPSSYAYLVSLTGDGDEGAWMALAGLPTFLAKMLTGTLTGGLLALFCPDPAVTCPVSSSSSKPPSLARSSHNVSELCTFVNGTALPLLPPAPMIGGDPRQCNALAIWGIIGTTTITSFFSLLILRRFIEGAEGGGDNDHVELVEVDFGDRGEGEDDDFGGVAMVIKE